jgi:hypothetical protein
MTYASGGLIQASDYNTWANSVNGVWGAGSGDYGYGQTSTLATVAASNTVTAAQWATLIARYDSIRRHQVNAPSGITQPQTGNTITYLSAINTVNTNIWNGRYTWAANGSATYARSNANAATWITSATREATISFASANAMRYFFNAGGYIQFSGVSSAVSGNTKSDDWETLLNNCGYVRILPWTSDRQTASGTPTIYNQGLGFWSLNTGNQIILRQYSPNTLGGYNLNYATFQARLNATAGSSTVMTVSMVLTDASGDVLNDTVGSGVYLEVWVVPPATTWISNTWGTPTLNVNAVNTQS